MNVGVSPVVPCDLDVPGLGLPAGDVGGGWLTTERVHRLVGVGVYLAALGFWHLGMDRLARTLSDRSPAASLVLPLCLYLAVTVAVPLVRLGWHGGANQMHEHLLTVTAAVAVVLGVLGVWRWLVRPLVSNP